MNSLTGRANFSTKRHHQKEESQGMLRDDQDRNFKRALGVIHKIDPLDKGQLVCTAWISTGDGDRRLWGGGKEIVIVNSPLDLLMRFGQLKTGMIVEILWRGIAETGLAHAHIIGEPEDEEIQRTGEQIPDRTVDTQSSLPFEPFALI
jgi:hypothetical protein